MYYAFNSFTGRLISSSHARSFAPQGLQLLAKAALPGGQVAINPYVNATRDIKSSVAGQAASTSTSTSTPSSKSMREPYGQLTEKMKLLREKFQSQKDEDVPVFLKGGATDRILYRTSITLCTVGFSALCYLILVDAYK